MKRRKVSITSKKESKSYKKISKIGSTNTRLSPKTKWFSQVKGKITIIHKNQAESYQ